MGPKSNLFLVDAYPNIFINMETPYMLSYSQFNLIGPNAVNRHNKTAQGISLERRCFHYYENFLSLKQAA